jgi:hypothetical protein
VILLAWWLVIGIPIAAIPNRWLVPASDAWVPEAGEADSPLGGLVGHAEAWWRAW